MKMNFARLTAQVVRRFGDREALVNVERGRRYTFRELDGLSNRVINMMRDRLNLRRGDSYLCILENDNLSLLHAWTSLKGEAAAAFTNYRDGRDEHLRQIDHLAPKVVFLENTLLDRYHDALRERGITVVCMDPPGESRDGLRYFWELLDGVSDADPGIENDIHLDVLNYRFTGGTTGRSKCAQYTTDNWLGCRDSFYAHAEQFFDHGSRNLLMAPISHGGGMGILSGFFRGSCAVTQNAPDLKQWCRNIAAERITMSSLVPTLLYRLLEMEESKSVDLSTLRTIFYGAAPMSVTKLRLLQERFGNIFVQVYGSTEAFEMVAMLMKNDHVCGKDGAPGHLASAGRVAPGLDLRIVDDAGREVADGETGEIWIRGRGTISGYYGSPEITATEFTDGFWKSGDLGYRDAEGFIYIVDRKKDIVITGGFNVYAIEVENAINAHPEVVMSVVVGVPHAEWGEAVHAEVVLHAGATVTAEQLMQFVKGRIGAFKAPKSIAFVTELPLSPVQKVLRRIVRDKYWQGQARRVG
jgi:Acyl-CoA synthetases (AMP-forming)/AMP-acid ligases II